MSRQTTGGRLHGIVPGKSPLVLPLSTANCPAALASIHYVRKDSTLLFSIQGRALARGSPVPRIQYLQRVALNHVPFSIRLHSIAEK